MLRTALDCGAGDTATFRQVMELILSDSPLAAGAAVPVGIPACSAGAASSDRRSSELQYNSRAMDRGETTSPGPEAGPPLRQREQQNGPAAAAGPLVETLRSAGALETVGLPNLLAARPHRAGLVELRHLDTPAAR